MVRTILEQLGGNFLINHAEILFRLAVLLIYFAGALYVNRRSAAIEAAVDRLVFVSAPLEWAMRNSVKAYLFLAAIPSIRLLSIPISRRRVEEALQSIGFVNRADMAPTLISRRIDKNNPRIAIWRFRANGIPLIIWEERKAEIETALGINIISICYHGGNQYILLRSVSSAGALPESIEWDRHYLSSREFELTLGIGYSGPVVANLADIPHVLIGGATGSGKSVLLKCLLLQALEKGAIVSIADFKGGVDFSSFWQNRCKMCFDILSLDTILDDYTHQLTERKSLFSQADAANLEMYNRSTGASLPRLILACDEIAEVLDKTGMTKQQKELIAQVEGKLSLIARQGRAFGVHLILATQRPDASILAGQIRNNINLRICGRADNVLAQIILDSTDAAKEIPKDGKGRFILHDGTIFQGFWLDEVWRIDS